MLETKTQVRLQCDGCDTVTPWQNSWAETTREDAHRSGWTLHDPNEDSTYLLPFLHYCPKCTKKRQGSHDAKEEAQANQAT